MNGFDDFDDFDELDAGEHIVFFTGTFPSYHKEQIQGTVQRGWHNTERFYHDTCGSGWV